MPASRRRAELFLEFFPRAFRCTTLSSVNTDSYESLMLAKAMVASFIVICDDLVDDPRSRDSELFEALCSLPFEVEGASSDEGGRCAATDTVRIMWKEIHVTLSAFPLYGALVDTFKFDLRQALNAIRYTGLVVKSPLLANEMECDRYSPHSMCMMVFDTMDLMATDDVLFEELGVIRALSCMRERMGRLSNALATLDREVLEGGLTSEICIAGLERGLIDLDQLKHDERSAIVSRLEPIVGEFNDKWRELGASISAKGEGLRTFDVDLFLEGAGCLHELYLGSMKNYV